MARGRTGRTSRTTGRRQDDLVPTEDMLADARQWVARTVDEVALEWDDLLLREICRRQGMERPDQLSIAGLDDAQQRHLGRMLVASGQEDLARSLLGVEHLRDAGLFCDRSDEIRQLRIWRDTFTGEELRAEDEVSSRMWGAVCHRLEGGAYAEGVALAAAYREHVGAEPREAFSPDRAERTARALVGAWRDGAYRPTPEESLLRFGIMDEWDLERASWGRAAGMSGVYGDPRGEHRQSVHGRGLSLDQWEHTARAALERPDLFGGSDPATEGEQVLVPLREDDLAEFVRQYCDEPAFFGWTVGYDLSVREPDAQMDALYTQDIYLLGTLRAQTPRGERTVIVTVHLGDYNADGIDMHLATHLGRDRLEPLGQHPAITAPFDATRVRESVIPSSSGQRVERAGEIIRRPPACEHLRAKWSVLPVERAPHGLGGDALALGCPDCHEQRLAVAALHQSPEDYALLTEGSLSRRSSGGLAWYNGRERMYRRLSGRAHRGTLADFHKEDGFLNMHPSAHLPDAQPTMGAADLSAILFG